MFLAPQSTQSGRRTACLEEHISWSEFSLFWAVPIPSFTTLSSGFDAFEKKQPTEQTKQNKGTYPVCRRPPLLALDDDITISLDVRHFDGWLLGHFLNHWTQKLKRISLSGLFHWVRVDKKFILILFSDRNTQKRYKHRRMRKEFIDTSPPKRKEEKMAVRPNPWSRNCKALSGLEKIPHSHLLKF